MLSPTVPSRCWTAIYTRQSRSSAGDFSSCDTQLSACLSFVMARLGDGWVWNGKRYDDEGQSGETVERPELQRLLADVRAGEIGRVVVYPSGGRIRSRARQQAPVAGDCKALFYETLRKRLLTAQSSSGQRAVLRQELLKDIKFAPAWMHPIFRTLAED